MGVLRDTGKLRGSERGFTLPEVLVTVIILGILAGIALPSWWSVIESRRVDTATNQMVGDLRLAHSKASSHLTDYRIEIPVPIDPDVPPEDLDYRIGPSGSLEPRYLTEEEGMKILTGSDIRLAFCADGSMEEPPSFPVCLNGTASPHATGTVPIRVAPDDGNPCVKILVNTATSRVTRATTCP